MKRKFIIYYFLGIIILLSSCNKEINIKEYKSFDHIGYYEIGQHTLAETEDGYYTLYMGLLNYIDSATKKAYLISKEKYSIDDLLKNDELREKSDAFYGENSNIFYDKGKLFAITNDEFIEIDTNNLTRKKITDLKFHDSALYKDGRLLMIVPNLTSDSNNEKGVLMEFDFSKKEFKEVVDITENFSDEGSIQYMYYEEGNVYILFTGYDIGTTIAKINLENKNIEKIKLDGKKYWINNFYIHEGNLVYSSYEIEGDEFSWIGKEVKYYNYLEDKDKANYIYSSTLPFIISSNGNKKYETMTSAFSLIKSDESEKNFLKDYIFTIDVDGKEYDIDEKYFLDSAPFIGTINSKGEPVVYAGGLGKVFLFDENREAVDVFANN